MTRSIGLSWVIVAAVAVVASTAARDVGAAPPGAVTKVKDIGCGPLPNDDFKAKGICGIRSYLTYCPNRKYDCDVVTEKKFPGTPSGNANNIDYYRRWCPKNLYAGFTIDNVTVPLGAYSLMPVPQPDNGPQLDPKRWGTMSYAGKKIGEACVGTPGHYQDSFNWWLHNEYKKNHNAHGDKVYDSKSDDFKNGSSVDDYGANGSGSDTHNTWASQEHKAQLEGMKANGQAAQWQRPHTANTDLGVGSCEDYVYKKYYDQERWLDAVYACKGDDACKVAVSLMDQSPGIAHRRLKSKDNPPKKIQSPLKNSNDFDTEYGFEGYIPKNDYYAGTGTLLTQALIDVFPADKQASLKQLADTLRNQLHAYKTAGGKGAGGGRAAPGEPGVQEFVDEWEWHAKMRDRNAGVATGQYEEYEHRGTKMREALSTFYARMSCTSNGLCLPNAGVPQANAYVPGDARYRDGSVLLSRAALGHVSPTGAYKAQPGRALTVDPDAQQIQTTGLLADLTGASSAKVMNDALPYLDQKWRQFPPRVDTSAKYPRLLCGAPLQAHALSSAQLQVGRTSGGTAERFPGELAACNAANVLLDEWARKQRGVASCLDNTKFACDWSPHMMARHFLNSFETVQTKEKDEAYQKCRYWSPLVFKQGKMCSPGANASAPDSCKSAGEATVSSVEDAMKAWRNAREKELKGVPVLASDKLGSQKMDQGQIGNDAFGAGYGYDIKWETVVHKNGGKACDLGARASVQFNANAHAFDFAPVNMVDVAFDADVNDTDKSPNTGHFSGHAQFMETYDMFDPHEVNKEINLNQNYSPIPPDKAMSMTQFPIAVIPAQVAWFTIIAKVDLGWFYGAGSQIMLKKVTDCSKPSLDLHGMLMPTTGMDVIVDVTVSVGGIAGLGVETDVTLVKLALPLTTDVVLARNTQANKDQLTLMSDLDLTLGTLDGSVIAHAEVFGIDIFKQTLIRWDGPSHDFVLFKTKSDPIDLSFLSAPLPGGHS